MEPLDDEECEVELDECEVELLDSDALDDEEECEGDVDDDEADVELLELVELELDDCELELEECEVEVLDWLVEDELLDALLLEPGPLDEDDATLDDE